ncbi:MAG: GNAT family N-acetyltransferase [Bacteroidales bacterium]|nr:GNAT family N-acetyltransferase [Bacteroidales bacterium]
MKPSIKEVRGRKDLVRFIDFPEKLYSGVPQWVPALRSDEFTNFNPKKNGAYEYCESAQYLALDEKGDVVGRVAAIINHQANKVWNTATVRFGWLDFIEDRDVLEALLDTVAQWGRAHGCNEMKGPLGFTDMDKEGSLVEGYEHLSPFTCLYNYPYYDRLLSELGFDKDVDWTQKIVDIPAVLPDSFKFCDQIRERFGIRCAQPKSVWELNRKYGKSIFHMYNETFVPLFEFAPLTDKQIDMYLSTYVPILDKDFVAVVVDEHDNPVGFAFCVPSLSKAVKKSRGRLLPEGVFRILHALKHNDTLEALMIGVLPEYQGKGAALLLLEYVHKSCIRRGIKTMIMNPQLETNTKVQTLFDIYETKPFMRRRCYRKAL